MVRKDYAKVHFCLTALGVNAEIKAQQKGGSVLTQKNPSLNKKIKSSKMPNNFKYLFCKQVVSYLLKILLDPGEGQFAFHSVLLLLKLVIC